jgi:hypothetical protein
MKQKLLPFLPAFGLTLIGLVAALLDPQLANQVIGWVLFFGGGVLAGRTSRGGLG